MKFNVLLGKENKKRGVLVLFLLLMSIVSLNAQELGDVNSSGTIDIVDALLIAQYAVGLNPAGFNSNYADVSGNGNIDITDALLIAQYTIGIITAFPGNQTPAFILGADISEAKAAVDKGVSFKDTNNTVKLPSQILKDHGFSYIRIRLLVNPAYGADGNYGLFQDLNYVLAVAQDAKSRGLKILLDFFFSDWWCDPGQNWAPNAWNKYTVSQTETAVTNYSRDAIAALKNAGAMPEIVQIGNEINDGMLWPLGKISSNGWSNLIKFSNAAKNGINTGRGSAAMPKIIIQYAGSGSAAESFFNNYLSNGGYLDAIGLSYYPMWHGTFSDLTGTCNRLISRFNKEIYIVESAYYWTTNQAGYTNLPYPQTPQGQYDYLFNLVKSVKSIPKVKGLFYWGTFWSQSSKWLTAPGWNDDDASTRALFDNGAKACIGIDAMQNALK